MKKFRNFLIALFALAVFAVPVQAVQVDMWANVYKWDGGYNADGTIKLTRLTSGVTFKVLAEGSDTAETLYEYNDAANTSLTNPITTTNFESSTVCNDMVAFSVDPTDSTNDRYVDLIVVNVDGGYTAFYEDFDKYTHTIVIDQRPGVPHTTCIWYSFTTTNEIDTGIDFEYDTLIKDTRVEVITTCSAGTIDVGLLTDDSNGLRDGVLLTTAGFIADTAIVTAGTSTDYQPDSTYGDLLYTIIAGTDGNAAHDTGLNRDGGRTYLGHVVTGSASQSLVYTLNSTAGIGYIYNEIVRLR